MLTSLSFVAGVITIARKQALAKELATVELLARVDTLCLDKTGTITTGDISYGDLVPIGPNTFEYAFECLSAVAHSEQDPNPTMRAIAEVKEKLGELQEKMKILKEVPNNAPKSVTNALYVGSTAELQKLLKGKKNGQ